MEALDIISDIEQEERNKVIIRWPGQTPMPPAGELIHEWTLGMTNEPEKFFANMERKHRRKATRTRQYEVPNIEQGLSLCRELYRLKGADPNEVQFPVGIDTGKPIFVVLHIYYKLD